MGKLRFALFLMRLCVFAFLLISALDKFVHPGYARAVWANLFFVRNVPDPVVYLIGVLQLVLSAGFLLGVRKLFCTGVVLLIQLVVTVMSWQVYLQPLAHVSAFSAFPVLAACYLLFVMRDSDTLLSANVR